MTLSDFKRFQLSGIEHIRPAQHLTTPPKLINSPGNVALFFGEAVIPPNRIGDFTQISGAIRRNDIFLLTHLGIGGEFGFPIDLRFFNHAFHQMSIQAIHTRIVELTGDGSENRQRFVVCLKQFSASFVLLSNVPQRIQGAALVELVQYDDVGKIDHVYLFQLGGRSEITGHHIHRNIHQIHNLRIRLADPRRFDDHQIVGRRPHDRNRFENRFAQGEVGLPRRKTPHIDPLVADGIHANPVAQQCAARLSFRGIHRNNGHRFVFKIMDETANQLVGKGTLARTPGARNTKYRNRLGSGKLFNFLAKGFKISIPALHGIFCKRDELGYDPGVLFSDRINLTIEPFNR